MEATKVVAQVVEAEAIDSKQDRFADIAVRELSLVELSMVGGGASIIFE